MHRREALLKMLQHPNLLEHEAFTEMLRMVFHLAEELDLRQDLRPLPEEDYEHFAVTCDACTESLSSSGSSTCAT